MRRFGRRKRKIVWNFLSRPLIQLWKFYYLFWRREKVFPSSSKKRELDSTTDKREENRLFWRKSRIEFSLSRVENFLPAFFPLLLCLRLDVGGRKKKRRKMFWFFSSFSHLSNARRQRRKKVGLEKIFSFSISLRPQFGGKIFAFLRFTSRGEKFSACFSSPVSGCVDVDCCVCDVLFGFVTFSGYAHDCGVHWKFFTWEFFREKRAL